MHRGVGSRVVRCSRRAPVTAGEDGSRVAATVIANIKFLQFLSLA